MKMIFTIFCLRHFLCQGLIFNRKTKFLAPLSKTKKFQHSKKSITESRDFGSVYFFRTVSSKAPLVSIYQNWFKPVYGAVLAERNMHSTLDSCQDQARKESNVPKLKVSRSQNKIVGPQTPPRKQTNEFVF